jgi:hypothetical protein
MATGLVATDHFEWRKLKPYLLYVGMFVATIYANMRALQHSNVETIIVFRAVRSRFRSWRRHGAVTRLAPSPTRAWCFARRSQCCPLVVCVLDWAFLGRKLPSLRSMCALLVVAAGCAGYVLTDRAFKLNGWGAYTWVSAYFVIISFEMAYGKHIVGPHLSFASSARSSEHSTVHDDADDARDAPHLHAHICLTRRPALARASNHVRLLSDPDRQCGAQRSTRTPSPCPPC